VVTSIELDHPDIYRDVNEVVHAFQQFLAQVPDDGLMIGWGDATRIVALLRRAVATVRYGLEAGNDWRATDLEPNDRGGTDFVVWRGDARVGEFELSIPGSHNVLNALAAMVVAHHVGVPGSVVRDTLENFRGIARRFEVKGTFGGVTIIDDYAHHPTEVRATLAAARARYGNRNIWAVFQPHTYSRTRALLNEFAESFAEADHVIVTEIYAARETNESGLSGAHIVAQTHHRDARFIARLDACAEFLSSRLHAGDVLITLGAGDVNRVGEWVAQARGE